MVYFLLAVFMVGCFPLRSQVTPTQEAIPIHTIVIVPSTSTLTLSSQTTPSQPAATSSPSPSSAIEPTSTQIPEPTEQVIPVCAGDGQVISTPADFGIEGTIVYQKNDFYGLYAIGGTPPRQAQIDSQQQTSVYGFSPNGNWLAYAPEKSSSGDEISFATPILNLLTATGERTEQELDLKGLEKELEARCFSCQGFHFFGSGGEWINNQLLYIHLDARSMEGSMHSSLPKVFDSMTGAWQDRWLDNLPDLYTIGIGYFGIHQIKLSPDLSRVLYPAEPIGLILRDLIRGTEIWSDRKFANPVSEEIQWSPDSKMVVVANDYVQREDRLLLLISRDGEVTQVVNAVYPLPNLSVYGLHWSPDSRYLAFVDNHNKVNLYLYDTQTKAYLYRCPLPGMTQGYPKLVWSPDGHWIAFGDQPEGTLQLLNVQSGEVIKLLDHAIPVGWSDKFPVQWP